MGFIVTVLLYYSKAHLFYPFELVLRLSKLLSVLSVSKENAPQWMYSDSPPEVLSSVLGT